MDSIQLRDRVQVNEPGKAREHLIAGAVSTVVIRILAAMSHCSDLCVECRVPRFLPETFPGAYQSWIWRAATVVGQQTIRSQTVQDGMWRAACPASGRFKLLHKRTVRKGNFSCQLGYGTCLPRKNSCGCDIVETSPCCRLFGDLVSAATPRKRLASNGCSS